MLSVIHRSAPFHFAQQTHIVLRGYTIRKSACPSLDLSNVSRYQGKAPSIFNIK